MKIYIKEFKLNDWVEDRFELNSWIYRNVFELEYLGYMMKGIYDNVLDTNAKFTDDSTLTIFIFCREELVNDQYEYVDDCTHCLVGDMIQYWDMIGYDEIDNVKFSTWYDETIAIEHVGELKLLTDEFHVYEDSKKLIAQMNKLNLDNIRKTRLTDDFTNFIYDAYGSITTSAKRLFEYLEDNDIDFYDLFSCGSFIFTSTEDYKFIIFSKNKFNDDVLKLLNNVASEFIYAIFEIFIADGRGPKSAVRIDKYDPGLTSPDFEDRIQFKLLEMS